MIQKTLLGIDFGEKKIGLAIKKPGSYKAIAIHGVNNRGDIFKKIGDITNQYKADTIILGLPLDMYGNDTSISYKVRAFYKSLREFLPDSIDILLSSERFSTQKAKLLHYQNPKKQKSWEQNKDSLAAVIIIEEFLKEWYQ